MPFSTRSSTFIILFGCRDRLCHVLASETLKHVADSRASVVEQAGRKASVDLECMRHRCFIFRCEHGPEQIHPPVVDNRNEMIAFDVYVHALPGRPLSIEGPLQPCPLQQALDINLKDTPPVVVVMRHIPRAGKDMQSTRDYLFHDIGRIPANGPPRAASPDSAGAPLRRPRW